MSIARPNRSVMTDAPEEDWLSIWSRPGIWPSWYSSGAVTVVVMTWGPAPG